MENPNKEIYSIAKEMRGKELSSYIKECYDNKKYIECIVILNLTIELLLKFLIKKRQIKSFMDMKISYVNNQSLCKDTTEKIDNLTLGNCFYMCFWFGLLNFNLYGKIKSHLDRRNKFTHSFESLLKMDLREIKLYYKEGMYIIKEINDIMNKKPTDL